MDTRREFLQKTAAGGIAGIIAAGVTPAYAKYMDRGKKTVSIEEAQKVHDKCLIIDGHNDMPVERVARGEKVMNWKVRDLAYHTDLPRIKEGGYDAAFFIVGNGLVANVWVTTERILEQIDLYPDDLMLVLTAKDAERTQKTGKFGVILSIEGAAKWLNGEADILRYLHRNGLRLLGISHGEGGDDPTFLQGTKSLYRPCTPEERENDRKNAGGLTPFGMEVLKVSNELGMVTDLSHINDKAFYEVMEYSSLPPIMSHTAVYALCNHARCMTDDQIKALAAKGGVMGVAFAPQFIHLEPEKATLDRFVEHICYVGDLVGIDYVAIGTDYDGLGRETIPIVPEVSQLVKLTRCMMEHGLTEEEIKKIWGGNFLRILKQTIDRRA
ncbi:MAG: dipeptidase [Candidatus Latescibacteria bacterium]|nr:dipeptidase [Candidatus Latescibacterota bacterium]